MRKTRRDKRAQSVRAPRSLRTSTLMVRLTDEERQRYDEQAARMGLSLSTWARMMLRRESVPKIMGLWK